MDHVLIVDDDFEFLEYLREGLEKHSSRFRTLTASNGVQAVKVLRKEPVSMLVTDLVMQKMDGLELLAHMTREFPGTPCIVMTWYGSSEVEESLYQQDILRYIEKPFNLDELAAAIIAGLDHANGHPRLQGVLLSQFVQYVAMDEKTCLLEVTDGNARKGHFYFSRGVLYDALCDDLQGEAAVSEMIGWENVEISFKTLPKKGLKKRINKGLPALLREAVGKKNHSASPEKEAGDEENQSAELDNVLIVDGDPEFLKSLEAVLVHYEGQFELLFASDGEVAISILKRKSISFVVTNLLMPKVDGLGLIAYLANHHPRTPCILMTEERNIPSNATLGWRGHVLLLKKSIDFSDLGSIVVESLDRLRAGHQPAGMPLHGLLQLIETLERTSLLEVHSQSDERGFIYLNQGVLFDAVCGEKKGEAAAAEMLGWDNVKIEFKSPPTKRIKRCITKGLKDLIQDQLPSEGELTGEHQQRSSELRESAVERAFDDLLSTTEGDPPVMEGMQAGGIISDTAVDVDTSEILNLIEPLADDEPVE